MREIVINAGFVLLTRCSCGGIYTEKYIKGAYRIDLRPRRKINQFTILLSGKVIKQGIENELQAAIQEIS